MTQAHEYRFFWTPREHVQASRATTRHMLGSIWLRVLPHVTLSIVAVGVLLILAVVQPPRRLVSFINAFPYLLILVLMNLYLLWWAPWLAAKQLQKADPSVKGEFKHTTTDQGFSVQTVAAKVELTWEHILQVVETPAFFLYYFKRNCAYSTPKRVIPNTDLPALRATLRARLGTRALLFGEAGGAA
jgi:Zn-dependent protease with chaperone function